MLPSYVTILCYHPMLPSYPSILYLTKYFIMTNNFIMTNIFNVSAGIAILSLMLCGAVSVHGLEEAVNLGTADDFAILTKTGVTTTGVSSITGDIGTSPIAATALTGFDLVLDPTTTFSTSSLVEGKVYAASYTAPTPSKMTTAISDMEAAFVDAAGRTHPDHFELNGGDLTAQPVLTPGLYKWSSSVTLTGDVTFKGSPNDIWILQIAGNVAVAPFSNVVLAGGALPKNIFWQVSGKMDIQVGAHVQGILLSQTLIAFFAGSRLTGRALAQTAVTMIATTVTASF